MNTDVRPHPPAPQNRLVGESHLRVRMTPFAAAAAVTARQAPEEQLLHQQALTVAEYLMLHLFKAPLRFRSNLHNQGGWGESRRRETSALFCPPSETSANQTKQHIKILLVALQAFSAAHKNPLPRLIFYLTRFLPPPPPLLPHIPNLTLKIFK